MRLPTASAIGRAIACPGSEALPHVAETTEWNTSGNVVDRYVVRARAIGTELALAELDDAGRELCAGLDVSTIPAGAEPQVAVAWDPTTGEAERLHLDGHRAYPDDGRYYGTFDLVGLLDDETVFYDDLKWGNPEPAAASWQLRAGAVFLTALTGAAAARPGHLRVGWNGKLRPERVFYDAIAIEEFEERLVALVGEIATVRAAYDAGEFVPLHVGPWCKYCPARRACPAKAAEIRTATGGDLVPLVRPVAELVELPEKAAVQVARQMVRAQMSALTPAELGVAYQKIKAASRYLEGALSAIRELAETEPVPLPNGRALQPMAWSAWESDAHAKAALTELKATLVEQGHIRRVPTIQVREGVAKD